MLFANYFSISCKSQISAIDPSRIIRTIEYEEDGANVKKALKLTK